MNDLKTVGERLAFDREKNGIMTQCSLAIKLKVSPSVVSEWESNQQPIPSDKLLEIQALGLDVIYILGISYVTVRNDPFLNRLEGTVRIDKRSAFSCFVLAKDKHLQRLWIEAGLFKQISEAEVAWFLRGLIDDWGYFDFDEVMKMIGYAFREAKEQENDN